MKHNYEALYVYYANMNDENDFDYALEALDRDERNDQLLLDIRDALSDAVMLKDLTTAVIKDMFKYHAKHCK